MALRSLDVVGVVAPPFGGVGVHVGRLACYAGDKGWRVRVFDSSKREKFELSQNVTVFPFNGVGVLWGLLRILSSRSIIHLHGGPWWLWCWFGFLGMLGRRVLLGVHTSGWLIRSYPKAHVFERWLFRMSCRGFKYVTVPHEWVERTVSDSGLPFKKIILLGSFVAPVFKSQDHETIPNEVWNFVKDHNPVLGACGFRLKFKDGIDVYGLDMLVSLMHYLRHSSFPNSGLVFLLPDVGDYTYFSEVKLRVRELNIENHILCVHGQREAYPVWPRLDVFIRPTLVDADALSVRECLCFGVPVVASDCVKRPKGVVTFKCRDMNDLKEKVNMVLGGLEKYRVQNSKSFADDFVKLYEKLARSQFKCWR